MASFRECSRVLKRDFKIEISHEGLHRAHRAGRITTEPDGSLDPAKVAEQLRANTHPGRGKGGGAQTNGDVPPSGYQVARTAREAINARIAEIEWKKLRGEVIEVEEVRRVVFARARRARDLLTSMPARLGPMLAGVDDPKECIKHLEDEVRHICDELATEGRDPW